MKGSRKYRQFSISTGFALIALVVLWGAQPAAAQDLPGTESSIQEYVHLSTPDLGIKIPVGAERSIGDQKTTGPTRSSGSGGGFSTEKTTVVVLDEDFETEGWQTGSSWFLWSERGVGWGDSSFRSNSGNWSVWCAAAGANAQPAGGPYVNDMGTFLLYGPIDLSDAVGGSINFNMWYEIEEQSFDDIRWMVSLDLENWYGGNEGGSSNGWGNRQIDFTAVQ